MSKRFEVASSIGMLNNSWWDAEIKKKVFIHKLSITLPSVITELVLALIRKLGVSTSLIWKGLN